MKVEVIKALPKKVVLPRYSGGADRNPLKDYEDRSVFLLSLDPRRKCFFYYNHLEGTYGTLKTPEDLLALVEKRRYVFFALADSRQRDWLWTGFPEDFQRVIKTHPGHWISYKQYDIKTYNGNYFLIRRLKWGRYPRYVVFVECNSVRDVEGFLGLAKEYAIVPHLGGMAPTGRDLLFGRKWEQFKPIRELALEVIQDYYSACKRPLMATSLMGLVPHSSTEDMITAYLEASIRVPSMSKSDTVRSSSPTYNPEAVHAVYTVEVNIPNTYRTAPSLFRGGEDSAGYGVYSATGLQTVKVGQQRATLWTKLGIPFKVLKAHKLLSTRNSFPFEKDGNYLKACLPLLRTEYPSLKAKGLYQAGIGGLLTLYEEDPDESEDYRALQYFNPIVALWIYEFVDIARWERGESYPRGAAFADRIDALSFKDVAGLKYFPNELFRLDQADTTQFYANGRNKDKRADGIYYRAVLEAVKKGKKTVNLPTDAVVSPGMVLFNLEPPENLGKPLKRLLHLDPENKVVEGKEPNYVISPEELIANQVRCRDPKVEEIAFLQTKLPSVVRRFDGR